MITVTQHGKSAYLIKVSEPELSWLIEYAKGMGMDRCSVLGASFTKGLEHYFNVIREIHAHEKEEPKPDDTEHKEFNKGSCQG